MFMRRKLALIGVLSLLITTGGCAELNAAFDMLGDDLLEVAGGEIGRRAGSELGSRTGAPFGKEIGGFIGRELVKEIIREERDAKPKPRY